MKLNYDCLLSQRILDKLGFTEYWDSNGTSGERRLVIGGPPYSDKVTSYVVEVIDETDDVEEGYSSNPQYIAEHTCCKFDWENMYFVNDLFESIKKYMVPEFTNEVYDRLCKLNLKNAIKDGRE